MQAIIEQMKPEYFNDKYLHDVNLPVIFRTNQKGLRYYFTTDDKSVIPDETIRFYPSVTTILGAEMPTDYIEKDLISQMTMKGYNQFMREKALYGTLVHICISDYLKSQEFDFDTCETIVRDYVDKNRIEFNTRHWDLELAKDMAALIQFIYDFEVEPIAIEVIGTYMDKSGIRFAGALDLLCRMSIEEKGFYGEVYKSGEKKGEPKETKQKRSVIAIVDFKSGKNGFQQRHALQLGMYKLIAEQSFGIQIEKAYNVAPKEWREEPTYHAKDQTEDLNPLLAMHYVQGFFLKHATPQIDIQKMLEMYPEGFFTKAAEPKEKLTFHGKVNGHGSLKDAYKKISSHEFVYNLTKVKNFIKETSLN